MLLPVNEIFDTLQGEATFTGTPSTFVRMQFCDIGCPWCDTRHTWELDPKRSVGLLQVLSKTADTADYASLGEDALVTELLSRAPDHVVITGGEPCKYNLLGLTSKLHDAGKSTQIETSGTAEIVCDDKTWVTVSPKYGMPGGYAINWRSMRRANEVKMPVGKPDDVQKVIQLQKQMVDAGHWTNRFPIWLQPLSQSPKATSLCVDAATLHGFKVSIQTHKFLGLR